MLCPRLRNLAPCRLMSDRRRQTESEPVDDLDPPHTRPLSNAHVDTASFLSATIILRSCGTNVSAAVSAAAAAAKSAPPSLIGAAASLENALPPPRTASTACAHLPPRPSTASSLPRTSASPSTTAASPSSTASSPKSRLDRRRHPATAAPSLSAPRAALAQCPTQSATSPPRSRPCA